VSQLLSAMTPQAAEIARWFDRARGILFFGMSSPGSYPARIWTKPIQLQLRTTWHVRVPHDSPVAGSTPSFVKPGNPDWLGTRIGNAVSSTWIMSQAALHRYTLKEYVELEESSLIRHEFLDGSIYAMAGGTPEHAAMAGAITASLGGQMGNCRVYSSDLRVRVLATGLATYPDVTVVCGPSERDPASPSHVTNPTLLVEVLSNATQYYDQGEKLEHYKKIPSLKTVILVSHNDRKVVVWSRTDSEWGSETFGPGATIPLPSVEAKLALDDIYAAAAGA